MLSSLPPMPSDMDGFTQASRIPVYCCPIQPTVSEVRKISR